MYLKNAQGDVSAVVDESGKIIIRYSYNAWGETEFTVPSGVDPADTALISKVSPLCYRGYCYDFDIGLYYLQSRYYAPSLCRFINADSTDYLGATGTPLSYNLFAYCENDPVNCVDITGNIWVYRGYVKWSFKYNDSYFRDKSERITHKDRLNWSVWGTAQKTAKIIYPDGARFYEHFRGNTGGTLEYDYTKAYNQDKAIKEKVDMLIELLKAAAPLFRSKNYYFFMSTELIAVQAENMNWRLAIGAHWLGVKARIHYNSKTKKYTMLYIVQAFDRYNFDKIDGNGNTKKFLGIPDEYNGRFVVIGKAAFFTSIGTMSGVISWAK